jgi:hypothetical protein
MNQNFAAIILGGTGQVGGAAIAELLAIPECREVVMVTRKAIAPRSRVRNVVLGYWGATEQKTRLRIQATSTIESDGLRSGRNRRMATIRDRLGHMTATQRLGSIKYLLLRANPRPVCWLWVNRSSTVSQ